MRFVSGGIVCLVAPLLISGAACSNGGTTPSPAPVATVAPVTKSTSLFDAGRAFADLQKQVAFGPRVPQTAAHDTARDWLVAELNKSTGNAKRQDFTWTLPDGSPLALSNIVAQFNPAAKKQILLCAHWDTRPTADQEIDGKKQKQPIPGANDGASGVAVLLELARNFASQNPGVGVQIVLFDGEDYGPGVDRMFLGARWYAKHPALPKPDYAILLDMIGDKDLSFPREKNSELVAPEINDKVWAAAAALGHKEFEPTVGQEISDDHLSLQAAGWKAIDLIDFNYGPWHTLDDTPDKCAPASLKTIGDVLDKVVRDEKP